MERNFNFIICKTFWFDPFCFSKKFYSPLIISSGLGSFVNYSYNSTISSICTTNFTFYFSSKSLFRSFRFLIAQQLPKNNGKLCYSYLFFHFYSPKRLKKFVTFLKLPGGCSFLCLCFMIKSHVFFRL